MNALGRLKLDGRFLKTVTCLDGLRDPIRGVSLQGRGGWLYARGDLATSHKLNTHPAVALVSATPDADDRVQSGCFLSVGPDVGS
jgi:hypothetical protein